MSRVTYDEISDRLYEAALIPELWPTVLDDLASVSETDGGVLFSVTPRKEAAGTSSHVRWVSSQKLKPAFERFLQEGWVQRNIRAERGFLRGGLGFQTEHDLFTSEEVEREPLYQFFRREGLGWSAGMGLNLPSGDTLVISFERHHERGHLSQNNIATLDALKGHIARSALLATRLALEKARSTTDAFAALGLPAAVLSIKETILIENKLFRDLMPDLFIERLGGRLRLRDERHDSILQTALHSLSEAQKAMSIPVADNKNNRSHVIHVLPVVRQAHDIFASGKYVLLISISPSQASPPSSLLQGLFDLTPAESRIAKMITEGLTLKEAAAKLFISEATVRTQMKAVFAKTGTSRQTELVLLLQGLYPFSAQTS